MSNTETTGTRCLRCGRQLRSPKSTTRGYGAWCQAKIRAAAITNAVTGFTTRQIEKARELITDGGLIPTRRAGVWRAVSGNGDSAYLVTAKGQCNCPAGLRSGKADRCYHVLSARLVTVTGKGVN